MKKWYFLWCGSLCLCMWIFFFFFFCCHNKFSQIEWLHRTQIHYLTLIQVRNLGGLGSFLCCGSHRLSQSVAGWIVSEAQERIPFQTHLGFRQDSVPYGCQTKVPFPLLWWPILSSWSVNEDRRSQSQQLWVKSFLCLQSLSFLPFPHFSSTFSLRNFSAFKNVCVDWVYSGNPG